MKNAPKVLCFGEALVDRLSSLGGNIAKDDLRNDCLGGAPANVACGLANLGVEVAFIGNLGNDKIGNKFSKLMLNRGVNTSCLQIDQLLPSRVVLVKRDLNGERSFGGFIGNTGLGFADESIGLNLLESNWPLIFNEANWLLVGTIPLAFQKSSQTFWWCIEKALSKGIEIAVDVNWRPVFWNVDAPVDQGPTKLAKDLIRPLLGIASLLKLSREEAIWFFNSDQPKLISESLKQKPNVVVTDGGKPIRWIFNNISGSSEIIKSLTVVDTTGAGDAFMAGLLCQLLQTSQAFPNREELQKIFRFAAACGAIVCSATGAIDPQPNFDQVEDCLKLNGGKS